MIDSFRKNSFYFIWILTLSLLIIFSNSLKSQELVWAKSVSGTTDNSGISVDSPHDIVVDKLGNLFVTGEFHGTITFGRNEVNETSFSSKGSVDLFLAKYNSEGLLLWAVSAGGPGSDQGFVTELDNAGNILVGISFDGTITFAEGLPVEISFDYEHTGGHNFIIAKFDTDGNLLWTKYPKGSVNNRVSDIFSDSENNIYITGFYNSSIIFNQGSDNEIVLNSNEQFFNIIIAKLDQNGNALWAKQVKSEFFNYSSSIKSDPSGDIYITGNIQESVIFGEGEANETTLTSNGMQDIFIAKYNTDGELIWVKQAGGANNDRANSMIIDSAGNFFLTGSFEGTSTFGNNETELQSFGDEDFFIAKYNGNGELLWTKSAGGSDKDFGNDIALKPSGNIYASGAFENTFKLDPGDTLLTSNSGNSNIFITEFDGNDGSLVWSTYSDGASEIQPLIDLDTSNNIFLSSSFRGRIILDPGETSETTLNNSDMSDILIAKYSNSTVTSIDDETDLPNEFSLSQNYPNPFNPSTVIEYSIPNEERVRLRVFDLLGREISLLVDEIKPPGTYSITFNAEDFVSGVYFYTIEYSTNIISRKMLLIK